jgi:hypothetical protein
MKRGETGRGSWATLQWAIWAGTALSVLSLLSLAEDSVLESLGWLAAPGTVAGLVAFRLVPSASAPLVLLFGFLANILFWTAALWGIFRLIALIRQRAAVAS